MGGAASTPRTTTSPASAEPTKSRRAAKVKAVTAFNALRDDPRTLESWTVDAWCSSIDAHRVIASILSVQLGETSEEKTELQLFRDLAGHPNGKRRLVEMLEKGNITHMLADCIWSAAQELRVSSFSSPPELSARAPSNLSELKGDEENKFHAKMSELGFSDLSTFFHGLEGLVGAPSKRVEEGMRREHEELPDAHNLFITPNYGMRTTSFVEWNFVKHPDDPSSEVLEALHTLETEIESRRSARGCSDEEPVLACSLLESPGVHSPFGLSRCIYSVLGLSS